MNKKYVLFFFLSSVLNISQAQTTRIIGTITDIQTGEPMIGVNVILESTVYGAATDIEGKYIIQNVPPGKYSILASYIGYEKQKITVEVIKDKVLNVDIQMQYSGSISLEEIRVTAQAKGQMEAINEQLSSKDIRNVVSKDRIRELPDANAAESVGRLPGVSILRNGGEGTHVVIRGMSPKYNNVMIEGVQLPSTDIADRSVDMSMISPHLLEGIEVMKAVTADQDANYVGGAVNFKMRSADAGLKYDILAQGGYNGLRKEFGDYILTGNLSNRFFDNKFGVFAHANIENRNRSANQLGADYYQREFNVDQLNSVYLENLGLKDIIRNKQRLGGVLSLDYQLTDGEISLKNIINSGITNAQYFSESFGVVDRNHFYSTTDKEEKLLIASNILSYEQRFSDFLVNAQLSHSYSEYYAPYDITFTFRQNGGLNKFPDTLPPDSVLNYLNIDFNKTFFDIIENSKQINKDREVSASADLEYSFSLSEQLNGKIKFGGKYRFKDRIYDNESTGGTMILASGLATKNSLLRAFPWMLEQVPLNTAYLPYSLFIDDNFKHEEFLEGSYSLGPVTDVELMHDIIDVLKNIDEPSPETYAYLQMSSLTHDYSGNENLHAAYIMADINLTSYITFIPGVRYEHEWTKYKGVQGISATAFPEQLYVHQDTTAERSNGFFLPMIHLKILPFDWFQMHFAYTKTLSRPDYNLIIPRMDIGQEYITLNNFRLRPEQAENLDIYFSFHQNYLGLLTIGGFSKNISDMIFWDGTKLLIDPAEYFLPTRLKGRKIDTQINNSYMAFVKGFEIEWQTNFWYLPYFLKGLVLNVNFTHINSEAKYPRTIIETKYLLEPPYGVVQTNIDTFYTDRLINQPDNIINLALGYDYKDFSCRLSMLFQSNIFRSSNFWPERRNYTEDNLRWDFSLKQTLPWEGLQVFLNITNLSSTVDSERNKMNKLTSQEFYGWGADLGIRWHL